MRRNDIRNIAIIAHVDHGKTTLVDCLLRQSGEFRASQLVGERILDSNELERERGITILAKNIAIPYKGVKINIIDTPGHADFGGEVERVLRMADGALVLVDAAEGPMPQTRFVLSKALECRLQAGGRDQQDRPPRRPAAAKCSTRRSSCSWSWAPTTSWPISPTSSPAPATATPRTIRTSRATRCSRCWTWCWNTCPAPRSTPTRRCRCWSPRSTGPNTSAASPSGASHSGTIRTRPAGGADAGRRQRHRPARSSRSHVFDKLGRIEVEEATAGDIVAVVGLEQVEIGDTISDPDRPPGAAARRGRPADAGNDLLRSTARRWPAATGKYLTSRHLRDRLMKELERNVALRVEPIEGQRRVRRHRPRPVAPVGADRDHAPRRLRAVDRQAARDHRAAQRRARRAVRDLVVEVPPDGSGPVMELVGARRGQTARDAARAASMSHVEFSIPARGLIGLRTRLLNATQGDGHHAPPLRGLPADVGRHSRPGQRRAGLDDHRQGRGLRPRRLQERAEMFVAPGDEVYEGMIVGENSRTGDMPVNPTKEKKLTNMRASGSDRNIILKPPRVMTLEEALEYIEDDELVEVTPTHDPPAQDPAQRNRPPPRRTATRWLRSYNLRSRRRSAFAQTVRQSAMH